MGQTLYLECYSGISGDMTVAALLDLGADEQVLRKGLESLGVEGFQIRISRVKKAGIDMCDFDVVLDQDNHDHDMEYLHGHHHGHSHGEDDHHHEHSHGEHDYHHEHSREEHDHHEHSHGEHGHHHEHRGLEEILTLIQGSAITPRAKETATRIFQVIAEAEAKAHGMPVEQVHFHEVGAIDSIVDIVAVAICLDDLDITDVVVPELYEGQGHIRCQHGIIPVPVPAVMHIAAAHGLKLHITDVQGELVTPTGAAIVAAVRTREALPEQFAVERVGLGAGKREYKVPGMVRAMLIRENELASDTIYRLETNIDDCPGEIMGYVMERLLAEGAKDVSYTPVFMKKNRPAYQLNVICAEADIYAMEQVIFQETTTIGIRRMKMERTILRRSLQKVQTSLGTVGVKVCQLPGGPRIYAEYEDVAAFSRCLGKPYYEVYQQIQKELKEYQAENLLGE